MKELVQTIVEQLVDNPEHVSVSEVVGSTTCVIEVKVAKEDLGKVIGKKGRTANSLRNIVSAISAKNKTRTLIEIVE